jgi:16S rRNA (cytidine1402-2'-O)-methyltransferase
VSAPRSPGTLYVVSTPIGNLEDLSSRATRVLAEVDAICCEDTRHTGNLLVQKQITAKRLISLHEHNESSRVELVLDLLAGGSSVAVVSDAGTPLLSDPGARLVAACAESGASVVAVPGASALLAALVVCGFDVERFSFEGFLPRKGSSRSARLAAIGSSEMPVVCYESPRRVAQTIEDLLGVCAPERRVAICRELTKLHEEVWRGPLEKASASNAVRIERGEYVLVIDGASRETVDAAVVLPPLFVELYNKGLARRDAIAAVEVLLGVAHREAYDAALAVPVTGDEGRTSST